MKQQVIACSMPNGIEQIQPDFHVAPQLDSAGIAAAKAAGFRSIINNRPDGEGGAEQPTSAELEARALSAGLVYHHLPVSPSNHSEDDARRMSALVEASPKPVLAFCRTGKRAAALYRKGEAEDRAR